MVGAGDPWNGRTLEWSTSSPAPSYNFAVIPHVSARDAFWEMKKKGILNKKPKFEDIEVPKNTSMGLFIAGFCFLIGFAMVWHIFWLAGVAFTGALALFIIRTFDDDTEYKITAGQLEKLELARGISYE